MNAPAASPPSTTLVCPTATLVCTDDGNVTRSMYIPEPIDFSRQWNLRYPDGWGPSDVSLDRLISWTQHNDPELKYFSGTAVYKKQFQLPADKLVTEPSIRLDLGDVQLIAEVIVNGENLGMLWKPPFQINVTDQLKPGSNDLEIRVTNLWVNRLIGDQQFPGLYEYEPTVKPGEGLITEIPAWLTGKQRRPETPAKTFTVFRYQTKESPLLESGLIGPVTLQFAVEKPIQR